MRQFHRNVFHLLESLPKIMRQFLYLFPDTIPILLMYFANLHNCLFDKLPVIGSPIHELKALFFQIPKIYSVLKRSSVINRFL